MVLTDGEREKAWEITDAPEFGVTLVTSDRNEAIAALGGRRLRLLLNDGTSRPANDIHSGLVELVRRGARRFHAPGWPPVVTGSGKIYYEGKIWDKETWKPAYQGRGVVDSRDRILVISELRNTSSRPRIETNQVRSRHCDEHFETTAAFRKLCPAFLSV